MGGLGGGGGGSGFGSPPGIGSASGGFGYLLTDDDDHRHHRAPHPRRDVYLTFRGAGLATGYKAGFDVLCGEQPPTVTGGYVRVQNVQRYMQRDLTIPVGYPPAQLTVNVIFGIWAGESWHTHQDAGQQTENAIGRLEWMAGAGRQTGPAPAVYVTAYNSKGENSHLIPGQYWNLAWIITSLSWGTSYRNQYGDRVWQEATVVLDNFLNIGSLPTPDVTTPGAYYKTRPGRDTALLIAADPAEQSPHADHRILAGRILADPKNSPIKGTSINLQRRSISWKMKPGLDVWVPWHVIY